MPDFSPAPAAIAPGRRVYAVGDVHGCLDRLNALHAAIAGDLAARPVAEAVLVHLGDYIDRGPDSAGVVAHLAAGPPVPGAQVVNLAGNHEALLLAALEGGPAEAADWMMNGAAASLRSWGMEDAPQSDWAALLPPDHLALLRGLSPCHRIDGYLFVHAGLRPGMPPERQETEDMLWIREPFLSHTGSFGAVVVHGHTPTSRPVVRPNRIGIDTGAVFGGRLTCAVLEGDRLGFISA